MDTPLIKRAYNLGLKAVPNFEALNEDQISYYEAHLDELPEAICRGFILPGQPLQRTEAARIPTLPPPSIFKVEDTDFGMWLDKAEEFAKKYSGVEVKLRDLFVIPAVLPWKSTIPVFDPGTLTNRDMVKMALEGQKLRVFEEVDVMKYTGSGDNKAPTLHLIENSVPPNQGTMNMSPDELRETGKPFLTLRGYGLGFSLHYFVTGQYLDTQTWTWFPENRLSYGKVADGDWRPEDRRVRFSWDYAYDRSSNYGARLAIPVPLKT